MDPNTNPADQNANQAPSVSPEPAPEAPQVPPVASEPAPQAGPIPPTQITPEPTPALVQDDAPAEGAPAESPAPETGSPAVTAAPAAAPKKGNSLIIALASVVVAALAVAAYLALA